MFFAALLKEILTDLIEFETQHISRCQSLMRVRIYHIHCHVISNSAL